MAAEKRTIRRVRLQQMIEWIRSHDHQVLTMHTASLVGELVEILRILQQSDTVISGTEEFCQKRITPSVS